MGKKIKRSALVLCVLALCISTMSMAASAASTVTANIPVQITLSGTEPAAPETFVVEITAAAPAYPMPAGTEDGVYRMELEGKSSETIDIAFNKLGVYDYTVKQVAGSNSDCYYDDAVYHVTIFVTNSESGSGYDLCVVIYRNEETEKRDDILFENVYANPDEVVISAIKTLDGKTPKDGAFTFALLDSDGKLIQTAKNVGRDITFEALRFYKVGTYDYQLKEVPGSDRKIVYDKTVYNVVVEVTKDDHGNYAASLTYKKGNSAYTGSPIFENKTKTDSPQTGDNFQIPLWILLLVLSFIGIVALVILSHVSGAFLDMIKNRKLPKDKA